MLKRALVCGDDGAQTTRHIQMWNPVFMVRSELQKVQLVIHMHVLWLFKVTSEKV